MIIHGVTSGSAEPLVPAGIGLLSYASKSSDISVETLKLTGMWINAAQTNMYIVDESSDNIVLWTFDTAGDMSAVTENAANFVDITAVGKQRGLWFNAAEDTFLLINQGGRKIVKYDLSTAEDLTTASFTAGQEIDTSGQFLSNGEDMHANDDLSKIFALSNGNKTVYRYTCSTPGDLSTGSFDTGQEYDFTVEHPGIVRGMDFNAAGTIMYLRGNSIDKVTTYSLSSAWDLTTVTYEGEAKRLYIGTEIASGWGLFVSEAEDKVFAPATVEIIYQYD